MVVMKGDYQTWKIKIIEGASADHGDLELVFAIKSMDDTTSYGITMDGELFVNRGSEPCTIRDDYIDPISMKQDMEMILDMRSNEQNGILSFKINGQDKGIAVDTLDINDEYFMNFLSISLPHSYGNVIIQLVHD